MPRIIIGYVRIVEAVNYRVGRATMYMLFVLMAILLWSTISKTMLTPALWTMEMAQFVMVAYFFLGGPYSLQMGSAVRMDLFYGSWSPVTKAWMDAFMVVFMLFYLVVLLVGGIESTTYAIEVNQRNPTSWRPVLWPIKVVMCIAIVLMILQATAEFCRDVARVRGREF